MQLRYSTTFLLLFLSIVVCAQKSDSVRLNLQQCLDIAVKNNLQIKQSSTNAQLARIDLRQARENLLPSITGNATRTFYQGRGISPVTNAYINQSQTNDSYNVLGSVTLFNGLALQNNIKAASLAYQAGEMNFQAAKDVVTVNVITAYLAILDNQELLAANLNQLAVQRENVDRAAILEKDGASKAQSDLTDQQGQLATNQVAAVNAQNNLDAAKLSLYQLMNIPYQPATRFDDINAGDLSDNVDADPDQMYQTALQQFAAVKAATLNRQSADKAVSATKGLLWPSLTLSGGLSSAYSNSAQRSFVVDSTTVFQSLSYGEQFKSNYNSSVALGLYIPIFTNGVKRNAIARARVNALYLRDVEENSKTVLKQNIEQSYYNMTASYKRYKALTEQVRAYTESYRIYKLRFDAGVINSVDFIIAKNNLDAAVVNQISAKYDYYINSKILDYYQGKPAL